MTLYWTTSSNESPLPSEPISTHILKMEELDDSKVDFTIPSILTCHAVGKYETEEFHWTKSIKVEILTKDFTPDHSSISILSYPNGRFHTAEIVSICLISVTLMGCILLDLYRYANITVDEQFWIIHRLNRHFAAVLVCATLISQNFASYTSWWGLCKLNDVASFGCYFYLVSLLFFWSAAIQRKMFLFPEDGSCIKFVFQILLYYY